MVLFHIPPGIQPVNVAGRIALENNSGGRVALDQTMFSLWQAADGCSLEEIESSFHSKPGTAGVRRLALACLVQAGLLSCQIEAVGSQSPPSEQDGLVSVVVVSHNSRAWLEGCLSSIYDQSHPPAEVILVDNGSSDGSAAWVGKHYPSAAVITLTESASLAQAINIGVRQSKGEFLLILNPDVVLAPKAVAHLLGTAKQHPDGAAWAAKLKFTWAPAFLNGLGNSVGAISWGLDNGLGHLDLGQLDGWTEVPSVCFAAALIRRQAWDDVGPVDEGFPLYYEDSEWSYRARLLGYRLLAAPEAIVYHAFSGRVPTGEQDWMTPQKLRRVTYGRLRFITRLLGPGYFLRFILAYSLEDLLNALLALLRLRGGMLAGFAAGWWDYLRSLAQLGRERRILQSRRASSDSDLFELQRQVPMPLIWKGLPLLDWDAVAYVYYPLLLAGRLPGLPAIAGLNMDGAEQIPRSGVRSILARSRDLLKIAGVRGWLWRSVKLVQWRLRQP